MDNIKTHTEEIICVRCETHQMATVEHTLPWYTHVHTCINCGYTMTESEWDMVTENT